jgi:short-subunit dehydrogenase
VSHPFADRAVVITGASEGIGAELARQLADQGAWLALAARRAHELDVVAQDCLARGGRAIVVPTDVTDQAQCEHMVARTLEAYGKIDVLVNNAGVGAHFAFEQPLDLTAFDRVMRVNHLGSVYCTYHALALLKKSKGHIVAISSLAGKTGVPQRTAYSASKFAMQGFFDSLRIELDGTGVAVTIVFPGFVRSSIRKNALGKDGKPLGIDHRGAAPAMETDECVRQIIAAMTLRKRELVMTPRWKLMAILKILFPGMIDRRAAQAIAARK